VVKPLANSVEASAKKHLLAESHHGNPARFGMVVYVDLIIIMTDGGRLSSYDINSDEQLYGMTVIFGRGTYQLNESIKKSCYSQAARDADPSYRCPSLLHNSRAFGGDNLLYHQCYVDNVCDDDALRRCHHGLLPEGAREGRELAHPERHVSLFGEPPAR